MICKSVAHIILCITYCNDAMGLNWLPYLRPQHLANFKAFKSDITCHERIWLFFLSWQQFKAFLCMSGLRLKLRWRPPHERPPPKWTQLQHKRSSTHCHSWHLVQVLMGRHLGQTRQAFLAITTELTSPATTDLHFRRHQWKFVGLELILSTNFLHVLEYLKHNSPYEIKVRFFWDTGRLSSRSFVVKYPQALFQCGTGRLGKIIGTAGDKAPRNYSWEMKLQQKNGPVDRGVSARIKYATPKEEVFSWVSASCVWMYCHCIELRIRMAVTFFSEIVKICRIKNIRSSATYFKANMLQHHVILAWTTSTIVL